MGNGCWRWPIYALTNTRKLSFPATMYRVLFPRLEQVETAMVVWVCVLDSHLEWESYLPQEKTSWRPWMQYDCSNGRSGASVLLMAEELGWRILPSRSEGYPSRCHCLIHLCRYCYFRRYMDLPTHQVEKICVGRRLDRLLEARIEWLHPPG